MDFEQGEGGFVLDLVLQASPMNDNEPEDEGLEMRLAELEEEVKLLKERVKSCVEWVEEFRSKVEEVVATFEAANLYFQQSMDSSVENQIRQDNLLEAESENMILAATLKELQEQMEKLEDEEVTNDEKYEPEKLDDVVPAPAYDMKIWKYFKYIGIAGIFFCVGKWAGIRAYPPRH